MLNSLLKVEKEKIINQQKQKSDRNRSNSFPIVIATLFVLRCSSVQHMQP